MTHVMPPWPVFSKAEREAVDAVLHSGKVNAWTGPTVDAFEHEWCHAFNCSHALAMANGTLTLEVALEALKIPRGSDVLVPPRTYVASATAVVRTGGNPVFADIDADSGCVTMDTLEAARTPDTRAAIIVHLGGWPADMPAIMQWAQSHDIRIIEDVAQAHGAAIRNDAAEWQYAGTFGDAGSWSFCQDKIMSTGGEGGMLVFKDEAVADRAWSLRDHGKSRRAVRDHVHDGKFAWFVESIGSNLRMTAMQAAIGRVQLQLLPEWIDARTRNAGILHEALAAVPWLHTPKPPNAVRPAWYRCYAHVLDGGHERRDTTLAALQQAQVPAGIGSCPEIYKEAALAPWRPAAPLAVARHLADTSLCFLCHPSATAADMQNYAQEILTCMASTAPTR
ncbi:MAG: DegT/DnrJ/EryC1/StrS family aminotransferase [Phycisphaerales bacterium]|nr:DegT/DnrJ/EryC1/StrS family aminotransferase [Phycisphaerales bacterium]